MIPMVSQGVNPCLRLSLRTLNSLAIRSIHGSIARMSGADGQKSGEPLVVVEESDGVRYLTLNNPKKRNALSLEVLRCLSAQIVDTPLLRCVVIRSNGDVFSSGHDLKELTSTTGSSHHQKVFDACSQLMLAIRRIEVPVVCVVDGLATAAGCQLVAQSDIVIASDKSRFCTPGASVGLFCSTPSIPLSRSANLKTSAYMLMTGRSITAEEALQSGLVSRVVSREQLESETRGVVDAIVSKSKAVIAVGKKFFYWQINQTLETAYEQGSCVMVENLALDDGREGISAFIDKRSPQWSHSSHTSK